MTPVALRFDYGPGYLMRQSVAKWLGYITGTRKVGGFNPGVATMRSALLLGP